MTGAVPLFIDAGQRPTRSPVAKTVAWIDAGRVETVTMTMRKIDKSDWATYFDHVSGAMQGKRVTIEGAPLQLGDLIEGERLLLLGRTEGETG